MRGWGVFVEWVQGLCLDDEKLIGRKKSENEKLGQTL